MSFNHAYDIAFEVPGSRAGDGSDVTPEMWLAALEKRVQLFRDNPEELKAAMDSQYDSYEEEAWIQRSASTPGVITRGGMEVVLESVADLSFADKHSVSKASDLACRKDQTDFVWVPADDLHADLILAIVNDEIDGDRAVVDLRHWLLQAPVNVLEAFINYPDCKAVTQDLMLYSGRVQTPAFATVDDWGDAHIRALDHAAAVVFISSNRPEVKTDVSNDAETPSL